jgi:Uma2 family endonuclease
MTSTDAVKPCTPNDLLSLEGGDAVYELVDGALTEKNWSPLAGATCAQVASIIHLFVGGNHVGQTYLGLTFCCFPHKPNDVRRPAISFVSAARVTLVPREGHVPIAPDLAIEIVAPGDSVYDLDKKVRDYREAHVPLTWVLNPRQRSVVVYENGRFKAELEGQEELRGEPVLPGFCIKVDDLFPAAK